MVSHLRTGGPRLRVTQEYPAGFTKKVVKLHTKQVAGQWQNSNPPLKCMTSLLGQAKTPGLLSPVVLALSKAMLLNIFQGFVLK